MKTIDWYLDTAKEKNSLSSDRQLAKEHLHVSSPSLSDWRTRKSFPKTIHMMKLAQLCESSEEEALLELQVWINSNNATGPIFKRALDQLCRVAACLVIALAFMTATFDAGAMAKTPTFNNLASATYKLCDKLCFKRIRAIALAFIRKMFVVRMPVCTVAL